MSLKRPRVRGTERSRRGQFHPWGVATPMTHRPVKLCLAGWSPRMSRVRLKVATPQAVRGVANTRL